MEATVFDSAQIAHLSDEYRDKLRAHWAVAMVGAIKSEDARVEQARTEKELGDYAQGNRPRSSAISPAEQFPQARRKVLPQASAAPPVSITGEERDAYEATIESALVVERKILDIQDSARKIVSTFRSFKRGRA